MTIKKLIIKDCGCTFKIDDVKKDTNKDCKSCEGTGKLEDSIYYIIDEKNKICFDKDTLE